jgi:NADPH-dependent curcumin reductase CurA
MPGYTAWYGLFELGRPVEGETILVSGAAGAVGSAVGQMARIAGCRVIGSAGSEEKLGWLRELGFDAVFNYREVSPRKALAELAPDGLDLYFDNVGGDHLEAAIGAANTHGRIVACGSIARYNDAEPAAGPRNMFMVVTKRLRIQGFIIADHFDRFGEFARQAAEWLHDGRLQYRETVVDGIENAPRAFLA